MMCNAFHTQAERRSPVTRAPHCSSEFNRRNEPILKFPRLSVDGQIVLGIEMLNGSMIPRTVRRIFDERAEPREEVPSTTAVMELRGRKHVVRLINISPSGAMVILRFTPHIGEQVALQLSDRGRVCGQVCWVRDGRVGVNFAAEKE